MKYNILTNELGLKTVENNVPVVMWGGEKMMEVPVPWVIMKV